MKELGGACVWMSTGAMCVWFIALMIHGPGLHVEPVRPEVIDDISIGHSSASSLWNRHDERLKHANLVANRLVRGPESIAVIDGILYSAGEDGFIYRVDVNNENQSQDVRWLYLGGRGLGLVGGLDAANRPVLWVADAQKGLVSIDFKTKRIEIHVNSLWNETDGEFSPIAYADDVDQAPELERTVYFSDATSHTPPTIDGITDTMEGFFSEFLSCKARGRLLAYDPDTRLTRVLLDGLMFANGVAIDRQHGDFVTVVETLRLRVLRYWIRGPKAGTSDVFIDKLPGTPDGISSDEHGYFWLAIYTPLPPTVVPLMSSPWLRSLVQVLPKWMRPKPTAVGIVAQLDRHGNLVQVFKDPTGKTLRSITSAKCAGSALYTGSLHGSFIGKIQLKSHDLSIQVA